MTDKDLTVEELVKTLAGHWDCPVFHENKNRCRQAFRQIRKILEEHKPQEVDGELMKFIESLYKRFVESYPFISDEEESIYEERIRRVKQLLTQNKEKKEG